MFFKNKQQLAFYTVAIIFASLLVGGLMGYSFGVNTSNSDKSNNVSESYNGSSIEKSSSETILDDKKINTVSESDAAKFEFKNYKLEKVDRNSSDKKYDYKSGTTFNEELPKSYYVVTLTLGLTNLSNKTYDLSYGGSTVTDGNNNSFEYMGENIDNSFNSSELSSGTLKPNASKQIKLYFVGTNKNFFNYKNLSLNNEGFYDSDTTSTGSFDYQFHN